jgi:hypothetical protein
MTFQSNANPMFRSKFAEDIFHQKYAHEGANTWTELCHTLVEDVCRDSMSKDDKSQLIQYMIDLKFIPGGRYLYYAGRPAKFFNNCLSGDTKLMTLDGMRRMDSYREGESLQVWSPVEKAFLPAVMKSHGEQEVFEITFAPIRGRSKRTWKVKATADHKWPTLNRGDVEDLRVGDRIGFADIDLGSNVTAFIHGMVFADGSAGYCRVKDGGYSHQLRLCGDKSRHTQLLEECGHSITYPNFANGDPVAYVKSHENLKSLPTNSSPGYVAQFIRGWVDMDGHNGMTRQIHSIDRAAIEFFVNHAHLAGFIVTGGICCQKGVTNFAPEGRKPLYRANFMEADKCQPIKVVDITSAGVQEVWCPFEPKHNRIVIDYGIDTFQCYLLKAEEDTREDWADLSWKSESCLMTGGGIGSDYTAYRASNQPLRRTGGLASGPIPKMQMINEIGRHVMQGGSRRSAIYASLGCWHDDVMKFIAAKDWHNMPIAGAKKANGTPFTIWDAKQADFNYPAPLDMTNISVNYGTNWLLDYRKSGDAGEVFLTNVRQALMTGEPGFSFNFFDKENETLRNACTEVCSEDDSDVCNLGSLNFGRIESIYELGDVIRLGTMFLVCGTLVAHLPYEKIHQTRAKNRRLGLGVMGLHEWLLKRGSRYFVTPELHQWLAVYRNASDLTSRRFADGLGISRPVANRAIAPTGCQRPDTLIVTDDGILELQEMGDKNGNQWQPLGLPVAKERGSEVATRFFVNGVAKTKIITLSSGAMLESTPNHQYRTIRAGGYEWLRADELVAGDKMVVALGTYNKSTSRDVMPPVRIYRTENVGSFPVEVSDDLARFLGLFYADGSIHTKGIRIACNSKEEDWKEVSKLGESLFGIAPTIEHNGRNCTSVCFNSSLLLRWLYINGWYKPECADMYLPASIRTFSENHLRAFIEGYFWGDGSSSNSARYIDTASSVYARQLLTIIRALGDDAAINTHQSGFGGTIHRVRWVRTKRRDETASITSTLRDLGLDHCTVDAVASITDGECETLDIEVPKGNTYIANGVVSHNTIGILAGTTTGIEPLFAVAYKRRYLKGKRWHYQYVVDSAAQEMIDLYGVDPNDIETALDLSAAYERRIAFQADVQDYVDQSIASTINLPAWGSWANNEDCVKPFADVLAKYAHRLRGFTCYPDGSRGGQPLTLVPYSEAKTNLGEVFEEAIQTHDPCRDGVCGV